MATSRATWFLPTVLASIATALACAATVDPRWHRWLDYQRDAIAAGQLWRLLTGHVLHLSLAHAALDIAALLLVAWIFGTTLDPRRQFATCLVGAACIDADLWMLHPEIGRYVGLSGLLHAWFVAGAVCWLAERGPTASAARRIWGAVLLAAVAIKLGLEVRDQAFWSNGAFDVVTAAHRSGALAGVLAGAAFVGFSGAGGRASAASPAPPARG